MGRRIAALLGVVALAAGCGGGGTPTVPLPTLRTFVAPPTLGGPTPAPTSSAPSAAPSIAPSASTSTVPPSAPPSATAGPTPPPTAAPTVAPTQPPTPAPTDSPAPTAPPTAPPTETPSPSSSTAGEIDRTSEQTLRDSLLVLDDLPAGLTDMSDILVDTTSDTTGFDTYGGIRVAGRQAEGNGAILRVIDERWQFPDKTKARKFLDGARDELGGVDQGLTRRTDASSFADGFAQYEGTDIAGVGERVFVQELRVKNVVARVQVIGTAELTVDVADQIGDAAAARMQAALLGDFPNDDEAAVLAHVPVDIASSCNRIFEIYYAEVESIRCRPSGGPLLDYSLFATQAAMDADFDDDLDTAGNPTNSGSCATGKYQNTYRIDDVPSGRLMCVKRGSSRVIEWTHEPLRILTYASSTTMTFDKLHNYWADDAGPYTNP